MDSTLRILEQEPILSHRDACREGTLVELITLDLFPLIYSYCVALKMRGKIFFNSNPVKLTLPQDKPTIKDGEYMHITSFGGSEETGGTPHIGSFRGCAVDLSGNIFVSDTSGRILVFNNQYVYQRSFGNSTPHSTVDDTELGRLNYPCGLTFNFEGDFAVVDNGNHRIQVFNPTTGEVKLAFGTQGDEAEQLDTPNDITVDLDGNYAVTDDNHRISIWTPKGEWIRAFSSKGADIGQTKYPIGTPTFPPFPSCQLVLDSPVCLGIAVDHEGNYVVAEHGNSRIQVFNRAGESIRVFGGHGNEPGSFHNVWGCCTDKLGRIIVADEDNNRIQVHSTFFCSFPTLGI